MLCSFVLFVSSFVSIGAEKPQWQLGYIVMFPMTSHPGIVGLFISVVGKN